MASKKRTAAPATSKSKKVSKAKKKPVSKKPVSKKPVSKKRSRAKSKKSSRTFSKRFLLPTREELAARKPIEIVSPRSLIKIPENLTRPEKIFLKAKETFRQELINLRREVGDDYLRMKRRDFSDARQPSILRWFPESDDILEIFADIDIDSREGRELAKRIAEHMDVQLREVFTLIKSP